MVLDPAAGEQHAVTVVVGQVDVSARRQHGEIVNHVVMPVGAVIRPDPVVGPVDPDVSPVKASRVWRVDGPETSTAWYASASILNSRVTVST